MAEWDVITQVDRQGAGSAPDVADDALAVMNKVASQPKNHSAPSVKSVPGPGNATPRVKGSVESSYGNRVRRRPRRAAAPWLGLTPHIGLPDRSLGKSLNGIG
jgi:hypothetical protein